MIVHHIGYVVSSIDEYIKGFVSTTLIKRIFDPVQQAELAIYSYNNISIELIEPKSELAFTYNHLKKNGSGYHHLCYEVDNVESAIQIIKNNKMIKVLGPVPAVLFDGKAVLFAFTKNKDVIEFLVNDE